MSITKETYSQAIKTRLPRLQQWEVEGLAQVLADLRDDRVRELEAAVFSTSPKHAIISTGEGD